jgi:glycerol-3-phosphate acyltransferase PlsY
VLAPLAAAGCVVLGAAVAWRRGFAWGARAGVFAFPVLQLLTGPVERVAGTGVLMTVIGLLFALRRRSSGRARSGRAARRRA